LQRNQFALKGINIKLVVALAETLAGGVQQRTPGMCAHARKQAVRNTYKQSKLGNSAYTPAPRRGRSTAQTATS
jgi:hypothetical protein